MIIYQTPADAKDKAIFQPPPLKSVDGETTSSGNSHIPQSVRSPDGCCGTELLSSAGSCPYALERWSYIVFRQRTESFVVSFLKTKLSSQTNSLECPLA